MFSVSFQLTPATVLLIFVVSGRTRHQKEQFDYLEKTNVRHSCATLIADSLANVVDVRCV
jgi:hypothetical protein